MLPIDKLLTNDDVFYIRFMDDWVVLAKARRHLGKTVKQTNQMLCRLKLEKHPDKTFIGLIKSGFDFLGYHFTPEGAERVGQCVNRWLGWLMEGLPAVRFNIGFWHC